MCYRNSNFNSVTSGFHRDADEIYALLGHNAASSGDPLPTFRDMSVPSSRVKKLYSRRAQMSSILIALNDQIMILL
jgi:hypothetical protein